MLANNTMEHHLFYDQFKPLIRTLQIAGLYFHGAEAKKWSKNRWYCTIIGCLCTLNLLNDFVTLSQMDGFTTDTLSKLGNISWTFMCVLCLYCWNHSCLDNIPICVNLWTRLEIKHAVLDKKYRILNKYVCIGWMLLSMHVIVYLAHSLLSEEQYVLNNIRQYKITPNNIGFYFACVFLYLLVTIQGGSWIFPIIVILLINKYLETQYSSVAKVLKENFSAVNIEHRTIKVIRHHYEDILKLTRQIDRCMKVKSFFLIFMNISIMCNSICRYILCIVKWWYCVSACKYNLDFNFISKSVCSYNWRN